MPERCEMCLQRFSEEEPPTEYGMLHLHTDCVDRAVRLNELLWNPADGLLTLMFQERDNE